MPQTSQQSYSFTVQPSGNFSLSLSGGWRLAQPYCKGGLAIDFGSMRCWTAGHAQDSPSTLRGYDLPAMGAGTNPSSWPQVSQARNYGSVPTPPGWNTSYGQHFYSVGLAWKDGLLWASGKGFYVSGGSYPDTVIRKYSLSVSIKTLAEIVTLSGHPMQGFGGGFVKGGLALLAGCGGYESGQESRCGPCWTDLSGNVVNEFPVFDAAKDLREKRPNNYSCSPSQWFVPPDGEVGYWFAGRVWGGGLVLGGKVCFWVDQGVGTADYSYQNDTFTAQSRTYLYRYGPGEHFGSYAEFATPGNNPVVGQEISPDGSKVYLLVRNAWMINPYDPGPLLCCYDVVA